GWRSPNFLYSNPLQPKLKLLLRNYSLSDDIAFRFSDSGWKGWPLTAEKFVGWLQEMEGDVVNLFMDYETFGEHQPAGCGIFDFMRALPGVALRTKELDFKTPSELARRLKPVGELAVPEAISWADEERDMSAWLGNELQQDAFNKLYSLPERLALLNDTELWADFGRLQESDHLYYMCTKFFSDGEIHKRFNPYDTPYEAFINFMNVLSDFMIRTEYAEQQN
ncbi:MAG: alpha-amylase, partial [Bacteroidales bacterium]|nr:alpha-amylase [Bacteroidales bacterium]